MSRTVRNSTLTFTQEFPKSGILEVPREIYSSSESIVIEGILNHFPFRTELRKNELKFSSGMQTAARVKPGKEATVEITRVGKEEEVRVPADLAEGLMAHPDALAQWEDTTTKARRDWVLWLLTARQSKTRKTRIEKACDMLAKGKGRVCCFGGLNWLIKDEPISPEESWLL